MNQYTYEGPVKVFDVFVDWRWKGSTRAQTEKKARSNLAFQFKKDNNLVPYAKVSLPGKLVMIQ